MDLVNQNVEALFIEVHTFNDTTFGTLEAKRDFYANKMLKTFDITIMGVDAFLAVKR